VDTASTIKAAILRTLKVLEDLYDPRSPKRPNFDALKQKIESMHDEKLLYAHYMVLKEELYAASPDPLSAGQGVEARKTER
jgi:hypothetical protein